LLVHFYLSGWCMGGGTLAWVVLVLCLAYAVFGVKR